VTLLLTESRLETATNRSDRRSLDFILNTPISVDRCSIKQNPLRIGIASACKHLAISCFPRGDRFWTNIAAPAPECQMCREQTRADQRQGRGLWDCGTKSVNEFAP